MSKLCEYCRGSMGQEDKFCPHCGAAVVEKVEPLVDPEEVEVSGAEETPSFSEEEPVEVLSPKIGKEVRNKRKRPGALILVVLALFLVTRCMGKGDKPPEPVDDPVEVTETDDKSEEKEAEEAALGWIDRDGGRYYLDKDGNPLTGWYQIDDKTYFFDDKGLMQVGRLELDGEVFLFDKDGSFIEDLNEYKGEISSSSEKDQVKAGWQEEDGKKYYYDEKGKPITGWYQIDEKTYYFDNKGLMQVGRLELDGDLFLFDKKGRLLYGLNTYGGNTYFSSKEGLVQTGWQEVEGKKYYFDEKGRQLKGDQGLVDFKRDPGKGLTITRELLDERYLYANIDSGEKLRFSSVKSYFEVPKIQGPSKFVKTAEDLINEGHFDYALERWELIKKNHDENELYDLGYLTSFTKSVRVFDSGDISTIILRQDEGNQYEDGYMSYASAFFVDNYSGRLVTSREQIESLGEDPDKVLETVRKVVNYQLGGSPGTFVKKPISGGKASFEDRYNKGEIEFTSPMEDLDRELVFLTVEDGEVFISAFIFYNYTDEDDPYAYPIFAASHLVRIPLNYEGPVERIYENEDFYKGDHSKPIDRAEGEPFSGIFDVYHLIYD